VVVLLLSGRSLGAQSTAGTVAKGVGGNGGNVTAAAPSPGQAGTQEIQTVKRTLLALRTEKLVAMATELKLQVDKTNKDILSCTVVQQAQEIEKYAHQLKQEEGKK
jgi:hypothetical protein